jgi:hypothetical protein
MILRKRAVSRQEEGGSQAGDRKLHMQMVALQDEEKSLHKISARIEQERKELSRSEKDMEERSAAL